MSINNSKQISDVKVLLKMGSDGSGIASIEKTGTSGIVDTYTITFDNGNKTTFTVTNGNGIASIEKTGTSSLTDTYTITFDDGTTTTFDVVNGRGISSIDKTATQGNVDTYTITYNDGTTSTFTVTNGEGATASTIVYDNTTSGLTATTVQDAIDEVDGNVDTNATNITNLQNNKADQTSIAPVQTTLVASQSYPKGSQFYYNNILYEATADIASGGSITIGGNATTADDIVSQISNFANIDLIATRQTPEVSITRSGAGDSNFNFSIPSVQGYQPFMAVVCNNTSVAQMEVKNYSKILASTATSFTMQGYFRQAATAALSCIILYSKSHA